MENQCATYISCFHIRRGLNFDLALYASRMSICALRTSLCGANVMCCWLMWVSPSYCKLRRNWYCGRRISLISTSPDFVSWANFEGISQLQDASDVQAKIVLGQCWYEDFKKQKIGTSTSTSTTVNCSQRPKVGNLGCLWCERPNPWSLAPQNRCALCGTVGSPWVSLATLFGFWETLIKFSESMILYGENFMTYIVLVYQESMYRYSNRCHLRHITWQGP